MYQETFKETLGGHRACEVSSLPRRFYWVSFRRRRKLVLGSNIVITKSTKCSLQNFCKEESYNILYFVSYFMFFRNSYRRRERTEPLGSVVGGRYIPTKYGGDRRSRRRRDERKRRDERRRRTKRRR